MTAPEPGAPGPADPPAPARGGSPGAEGASRPGAGEPAPGPARPAFEVVVRRGEARVEPSAFGVLGGLSARAAVVIVALLLAPLVVNEVMTRGGRAARRASAARAQLLEEAARKGAPDDVLAWADHLAADSPSRAAELLLRLVRAGDPRGAERLAALHRRAGRPVLAEAWRDRAAALEAARAAAPR